MPEIKDPHCALAIKLRVKNIVEQPRFCKSDLDKLAEDVHRGHHFQPALAWKLQAPYFRVIDGLKWSDLGATTYDETLRRIAVALELPEDLVKPLYITKGVQP